MKHQEANSHSSRALQILNTDAITHYYGTPSILIVEWLNRRSSSVKVTWQHILSLLLKKKKKSPKGNKAPLITCPISIASLHWNMALVVVGGRVWAATGTGPSIVAHTSNNTARLNPTISSLTISLNLASTQRRLLYLLMSSNSTNDMKANIKTETKQSSYPQKNLMCF